MYKNGLRSRPLTLETMENRLLMTADGAGSAEPLDAITEAAVVSVQETVAPQEVSNSALSAGGEYLALVEPDGFSFRIDPFDYYQDRIGNEVQVQRTQRGLRLRFVARAEEVSVDCGGNPTCEEAFGTTATVEQVFDMTLKFTPGTDGTEGTIHSRTRVKLDFGPDSPIKPVEYKGIVSGHFLCDGTACRVKMQIDARAPRGGKLTGDLTFQITTSGSDIFLKGKGSDVPNSDIFLIEGRIQYTGSRFRDV